MFTIINYAIMLWKKRTSSINKWVKRRELAIELRFIMELNQCKQNM